MLKADAPAVNSVVEVSIALGVSPQAASSSSQTTTAAWSARATREPGCAYIAGDQAVPMGSFALQLRAVDLGAGTARGSLQIRQSVHAVPMVDCGPGDAETIELEF
jgi:hypothetical protein